MMGKPKRAQASLKLNESLALAHYLKEDLGANLGAAPLVPSKGLTMRLIP